MKIIQLDENIRIKIDFNRDILSIIFNGINSYDYIDISLGICPAESFDDYVYYNMFYKPIGYPLILHTNVLLKAMKYKKFIDFIAFDYDKRKYNSIISILTNSDRFDEYKNELKTALENFGYTKVSNFVNFMIKGLDN